MASLPPITYPSFQHENPQDLTPRERKLAAESPSPLPPRTYPLTPPPQTPSTPPSYSATAAPQPPQALPQTQSPLFAFLPVRLRRLIYTALLGGKGVLATITRERKHLSAVKYPYIVGKHEHINLPTGGFVFPDGAPGMPISTVMTRAPGLRMLPLIRTCRRIYIESIDLIYSVPTFLVDSFYTIPSWLETTPPHRFDAIRSLYLNLTSTQSLSGRSELREDMWRSTCVVVAGMKGLRVLRVVLSSQASRKATKDREMDLLEPLGWVKGVPDFEVTVEWQLIDGDWEDGDWPFRLVRPAKKA